MIRRPKLGRTSVREIVRLSKEGIKAFRHDRPAPEGWAQCPIVIRWGCTAQLDNNPLMTVNPADKIKLVNDKAGFRKLMQDFGFIPKTWFSLMDFLGERKFPVIVRPRVHAQGKKLYFCNNDADLYLAISLCGEGFYISEYIPKVAEYRIFVVQGRCVCVAKKNPANPQAIAWNVAQGGNFENVNWNNWPLKAVKVSIGAMLKIGLDVGGVDVMVDAKGQVYILEINSAPSLTSPYRQQCFAKALDHIVRTNSKATIPLQEAKGGYTKFIHPAVKENV